MRQSAVVLALIVSTVPGCAPGLVVEEPAPVTVVVHNPTATALPAQICGGAGGCSEFREIRPGASARFRIHPGRVSRAVVTARRGTRVANFPVDYLPGEVLHVTLSLP